MLTCATMEDSDQPVHMRSLIRFFNMRYMGSKGSNYTECADSFESSLYAHANLTLILGTIYCTVLIICNIE